MHYANSVVNKPKVVMCSGDRCISNYSIEYVDARPWKRLTILFALELAIEALKSAIQCMHTNWQQWHTISWNDETS